VKAGGPAGGVTTGDWGKSHKAATSEEVGGGRGGSVTTDKETDTEETYESDWSHEEDSVSGREGIPELRAACSASVTWVRVRSCLAKFELAAVWENDGSKIGPRWVLSGDARSRSRVKGAGTSKIVGSEEEEVGT
jgi:hypothetical protein